MPALVAAQPTSGGRTISRLTVWQDRAYISYGDYGADTGPIHALVLPLDGSALVDEATLTTEQTWRYLPIGGKLYQPFMDPQGGIGNPENGCYAVATTPGSWTTRANITPYGEHLFDMATADAALWLAGASEGFDAGGWAGSIWKSTDDGVTWTEDLNVPGATDDLSRIYALLPFGDELVAVGSIGGTPHTYHRPAAGVWTEISDSSPHVSDAIPFTSGATSFYFCLNWGKDGGSPTPNAHARVRPADAAALAAIQAAIPAEVVDQAIDAVVAAGNLWVLTFLGTIWKATTAGVWTKELTAPAGAGLASIAADTTRGYLYFGTRGGRVERVPIPA